MWAQHHTVIRRILASPNVELRERYGHQLRTGSLRAGVTYAGAMSDTMLIAHKTDDGYRLEGASPFLSGWGMVDLIGVFARSAESDQELISVLSPAAMFGIWLNGSLALGIARRCIAELSGLGLDVGPLAEEKAAVRRDLDAGLEGTSDTYAARADLLLASLCDERDSDFRRHA